MTTTTGIVPFLTSALRGGAIERRARPVGIGGRAHPQAFLAAKPGHDAAR